MRFHIQEFVIDFQSDDEAQARSHGGGAFRGSASQMFLCPPKFCCYQNNLFSTYNKHKNLAP